MVNSVSLHRPLYLLANTVGNMKQLLVGFGLMFCCILNKAQNYVDIIKVSTNTTSNNKFDSSNATTKLNQVDVDLTIPIKLNEKTAIITGIIYERFETKLMADGPIKSFGSGLLKLGVNKTFNDKWSGTFVLLPKIASDYGSFESKDFQMGAIGLLKYKKRENLNYRLGLYYNSELFGPLFVPMFGLHYLSANSKLEVNLMLPLMADVNYKIIPFMSAGLNFNGQIRTYHLNKINSTHSDTYLTRATNEFYTYLKFDLTKNFILQTKVGYSVARNLRVYDSNDKVTCGFPAILLGDERKQLNSDYSDGLIFKLVLTYRIHLASK